MGQTADGNPICLLRHNCFPTGLLPHVIAALQKAKIGGVIVGMPPPGNLLPVVPTVGDKTLRDYQVEAINAMLENRRGLVGIATGGGKTEVWIGFLLTLNPLNSLFIVPTEDSREQYIARARDAGLDVAKLTTELTSPHLVSTPQYINRHATTDFMKQLLAQVQVLCFDEAHHVGKAPTWLAIAQNCPAIWRFGLTATPFHNPKNPYAKLEDMQLIGALGGILVDAPVEALQTIDVLETPDVCVVHYNAPKVTAKDNDWHILRKRGLTENKYRNAMLVGVIQQIVEEKRKPLLLIELVSHGKRLQEYLYSEDVITAMCKGQSESFVIGNAGIRYRFTRERIVQEFLAGDIQAMIATTVWDESFDLPEITDVVLGGGGKGGPSKYQKTLQRVGRALRKSDSKETVRVWLPWDAHNGVLKYHSSCQLKALRDRRFPIKKVKYDKQSKRVSVHT